MANENEVIQNEVKEAPKGLMRTLILDGQSKAEKKPAAGNEDDGDYVNLELGNEAVKPDLKETPAEKQAREKSESGPTARNYERFKAYADKEITNDDELEEVVKSYKTKAEKLEVLVKGDAELQGNDNYKFLRSLITATPEQKVTARLVAKFMDGGYSQEEATKKAGERIEKNKANTEWLEDEAMSVTAEARNLIKGMEKEAVDRVSAAKKDVTFVEPAADFEKAVQEDQTKITDFLGMKLSKDDKERAKILKESYIEPTKLNTMLKDPRTYNKVCMFLSKEKNWTANIENRTNGKSKLLDASRKTPSIGSGLGKGNNGNSAKPSGFQVTGRLARKTS